MKSELRVLALGGDGIGPEVVAAALKVLEKAAGRAEVRLIVEEDLLGGAAWDRFGTFCRDETVALAKTCDAVLVGAVGGPKWDALEIQGTPMQKDGLVRLRFELDVYAGLRPARAWGPLLSMTPFREKVVAGADVLVLREMCGGVYFGTPRGIDVLPGGGSRAHDTNVYTSAEIERVAAVGFELARARRGRLASIDKANVMESGVLWRRVVAQMARDYPDVTLEHLYADNAIYQLICNPHRFDVILGDNLFGDLVSDLAGVIAGSLAMLPSACLPGIATASAGPGIYEAVHGSAPDIAGLGIANPIGTILSVALMFTYALSRPDIAAMIEDAVERALAAGVLTRDLGGIATTNEITDAILREMS